MIKQKIVLIDWSFILFQSIKSREGTIRRKEKLIEAGKLAEADKILVLPETYLATASLMSVLKKIGIDDEVGDQVILLGDSHSWRKEIETEYKGNRVKISEEIWRMLNELTEKIVDNLPFFYLKIQDCECDDIISMAVRLWKDKECVVVSPDADFQQLLTFDNVKLFSNHSHPSVKKCPWKILDLDREKEKEKAYKSFIKKINKESTDNLITDVANEEQYDNRIKCVKLTELPPDIEAKIIPELQKIENVEKDFFHPEVFSPGIQKKLEGLFSQDNILTYQSCRDYIERKLKKEQNKKLKLKEVKLKEKTKRIKLEKKEANIEPENIKQMDITEFINK